MKTPHATSGILEINYKSPPCLTSISPNKLKNNPCLITKTEYLRYFIVKFKIKCLPASRLSIAFSDTDVIVIFACLTKNRELPKNESWRSWVEETNTSYPSCHQYSIIKTNPVKTDFQNLFSLNVCNRHFH